MLSSTVTCPRCGGDAIVTIFGPNGPDLSRSEISCACACGHEVTTEQALAAWEAGRGARAQAS